MCFYVCSHCDEHLHFGFTPTTYFTKEHADFMSPSMKTEDACSSKRCDCAVNLLVLTSEALFQFQGSLCFICSGKYFGATTFTPISSSASPSPLPDGIITSLNHINFHLCLMLYNLDQESPKRFGVGPQMCLGSRTAHINTIVSERVIYFTDKLCHF